MARKSPYVLKLSKGWPELFRESSVMSSQSAANCCIYKVCGKQLLWHLTLNIGRGPRLEVVFLQH